MSSLSIAKLKFFRRGNPDQIRAAYFYFTQPHPKYWLFRLRTMGVALIDLTRFNEPSTYLGTLSEKGPGGAQSEKARSRGYDVRMIDLNDYMPEIENIRLQMGIRREAPTAFRTELPGRHYATFSQSGGLVAYCTVYAFGNFASIEELAGYKKRDGAMYLMLTEIICRLIEERSLNYLMFGAFLCAKSRERKFKLRLGFSSYRVRYTLV